MSIKLPLFCRSIVLSAFLMPAALLAQGMVQGTGAPFSQGPGARMSPGAGDMRSSSQLQAREQVMRGMIGKVPIREVPHAPGIPYVTNPYSGMFGSMGNVYSPYYRQFHQSGMSGPFLGATSIPGVHYNVNPYAGMYGSMGNVYSPYYRQFHQSGMGGKAGVPSLGAVPGQGIRYHYPYFMPPTMGGM